MRFAIIYFVTIIIIAHFFAPPEYLWTQHTISDLAAQGLEYQWIMQLGFIGFGLLLNISFVIYFVQTGKVYYPDLLIMFYGVAVLLSGFYSAKPFLEGISFSEQEHQLHSSFAMLAGIFFSLGIFLNLIVNPHVKQKRLHTLFLLLVISASLAFGLAENEFIPIGKGIIQRTLYLVSFIWLSITYCVSSLRNT